MDLSAKQLFLIDGLGALLSAFLLGVVLVKFENVFGMPRNTLYILAFLPCLFAIYDLYCYLKIKKNHAPFLKGIAIANLSYCVISIGFAFHHYEQLTTLGWTYFILEIVVVVIIAIIELKAAKNITT